jgi:hypothetical protein
MQTAITVYVTTGVEEVRVRVLRVARFALAQSTHWTPTADGR